MDLVSILVPVEEIRPAFASAWIRPVDIPAYRAAAFSETSECCLF